MKLLACFLVAASAWAAVNGTVINGTNGKPQPGATVTLYKLGGAGMESIESVKSDARGAFAINQTPQGPHLIQTAFDGVTYNHMLPPGSPASGIQLEVYNASKKQPPDAKVSQHMVLLEPNESALMVSESIVFENTAKLAYNDPDGGTMKFYLPEAAGGQVRVTCTAPQGMPIQQKAEKTSQANVYMVGFPVKPGETRFDLTYQLPFTSPGELSGRILHKEGLTRLVAPQGVTIKGDNLKLEGQEPRTHASVYTVTAADYRIRIEGTGSLRGPAASADDDSRPTIQQILPRLYDNLYLVLGLAFAILAVGFVLFYRREARPAEPPPARGKTKA